MQGNIRVFCRVRPILPSELPPVGMVKSTSSTGGSSSKLASPTPEDEEKLREAAKAEITYPDKMDHKEIVLRSSSESATGQERKDEWAFNFDRVRQWILSFDFVPMQGLLNRYLNQTLHNPRSLRRSHNSLRVALTVITFAYSHTVRRVLESLSRWKAGL